jgi:hypothetical protein
MPETPPGYTPYPRHHIDPPHLNLGLDVLPEAWAMFKKQPLLWLANGLIATIVVVPYLVYVARITADLWTDPIGAAPKIMGPLTLVSFGTMWFLYFHMAGSYPLVAKQLKGEEVGWTDVLDFNGRALATLLSTLIMSGTILVGYLFCYLPGPIAEGITMEAPFRVVDLGENPFAAMAGSYREVKPRLMVASVVVHLLTIVISLAILTGIGLLIGAPLYNISRGLLYHRLREAERIRSSASQGVSHPY